MKFFAYTLLISTTQAATALTTPAVCFDSATNTALAAISDTDDAATSATKYAAVVTAAHACTKDAAAWTAD